MSGIFCLLKYSHKNTEKLTPSFSNKPKALGVRLGENYIHESMKKDYKILSVIFWVAGILFLVAPTLLKIPKGNALFGGVSILFFLFGTMFWMNRKK